MSQKRMFDKSVIETDNFLNVSMSAKALYFLLGMEADDEGFVSPNRVIRLYGGEIGDIKNLIDVKLIIPFQSGVVVITNWNQNNWLDSRRIKPTQYQEEKKLLELTEHNKYVLSNGLADAKPEERRVEESRVVQKSIYGEFENVKLTLEEFQKLKEKLGENNTLILIEELSAYIASKGKRYASHYATIQTWARMKFQKHNEKLENKRKIV